MKYKIEKNVYLAQPEIKTKQDEKQLLSSIFFRWWMKSKWLKVAEMLDLQGLERVW